MAANEGPALVKGTWVAMAIAFIIVTLRVIAKIKIRKLGVDDALMIAALGLSISSTAILTMSVSHGFGKDLLTLSTVDQRQVLKDIAIQVPLITFSTTAARTSFILYLLQILNTNRYYRIALWATLLLQGASNIVSGVLPLSICRNPAILWNIDTKTTCGNTTAVVRFSYFSSSVNTVTDFFLALFPAIVFWNLNLKLRVKISLILLLSFGLLAMVASILKTTALDQVPSVTDLGASGAIPLFRWGYAENAIIIITSSAPAIRPLIMSSVRKVSSAAKSRGYELSNGYSGNKATARNNGTGRYGHENTMLTSNRPADTESIERILGDEERRAGIKKQVDISVMSIDHSHNGPASRLHGSHSDDDLNL